MPKYFFFNTLMPKISVSGSRCQKYPRITPVHATPGTVHYLLLTGISLDPLDLQAPRSSISSQLISLSVSEHLSARLYLSLVPQGHTNIGEVASSYLKIAN